MSEYVYERIATCTVCGRNEIEWGQQTQKGQTSLELTTATTTGHEANRNKFPIISALRI